MSWSFNKTIYFVEKPNCNGKNRYIKINLKIVVRKFYPWLYRAKHTEIGNFRSLFALLPPKDPKNQDFKKWGNLLEISFYTCTKNHNHMIYGSWDMECNRQNVLSLWIVFCLFTLLWTQKIKILKNKKILEDIIILQMFTINDSHIINFVCYFGPFFAILPPPPPIS